ncbi:hypothetical protein [Rhodopseudomonas palustris]|uniref:hypothetical protein n=1 Tax=Rhodopseudomonas palustris TaxID=1076 RepID=UPI00142EF44E
MARTAEEDDAVTGGIAAVRFQLVVWNHDLGADLQMRAAQRGVRPRIGDDGDVLAVGDFMGIRPIGVGLAAARHGGEIRLHQRTGRLAKLRIAGLPLSEIARGRRDQPEGEPAGTARRLRQRSTLRLGRPDLEGATSPCSRSDIRVSTPLSGVAARLEAARPCLHRPCISHSTPAAAI